MVEGPGCKLKGEKIKAKLLKQTVKDVKGNAVDRAEKSVRKQQKAEVAESSGAPLTENPFQRLVGHTLDDVLTLGKELFMFFGESCLRVHFLMAGSFRVNNEQVDKDGGKNVPATSSLEIQFSKDTLTFYKTGAEIRPSSACRQKHLTLKDLDICSPTFNPKRAVTEMMLDQERQLCDVLLDQEVLPGVGNIIKNEALFDSGLKPDSKIKELSEEHISHLVKMTRDFSMVFYQCRKNGTNLRQYMKVYHKGKCGECESKIVTTRMGEDNQRVTYFCPACQTNHIKKRGQLKLPSKNSLLGWVQSGKDNSGKNDWTCSKCTLLNAANQSNCSVCLAPRNNLTASPAPAQPKRKATPDTPNLAGSDSKRFKTQEGKVSQPQLKKTGSVLTSSSDSQQPDCSKIPTCSSHKIQCFMRQTFKENENKGRWFFTCAAVRGSKRCNFFQWADEGFPHCTGHSKVCALRTVMKQGANNGRRFFCCPLRKDSCQFFEWAPGYG